MCCAVRHDYARAATMARLDGADVCFDAPGQPSLRLCADQPLRLEQQAAVATFELGQELEAEFLLGAVDDPRVKLGESGVALQHWIGRSTYRGRWREAVNRSALALKLLTSRKHGAILAAATFGLPESRGGERNWDYRYTWIRDASFTVYAFMRLGYVEVANDFMRWLRRRIDDGCDQSVKLNVLYAIDGTQQLPEIELAHLSGYGNARPVRIGNQAWEQVQLDIFGELMDAVYLTNKYGEAISHQGWLRVGQIIDHVCANWNKPDVGIWEMRGGKHHFLHSRLMCWVALDRAIRLASKRSLPAPFARWDETRTAIHNDIWSNFWNAERGHFVQHTGGTGLDGSMLLMPLVRFVGATDPHWLATLDAIEKSLVRDGMVYRYRNDDHPMSRGTGASGVRAVTALRQPVGAVCRGIRSPGTAPGQHAASPDPPGTDQRGLLSRPQAQRRCDAVAALNGKAEGVCMKFVTKLNIFNYPSIQLIRILSRTLQSTGYFPWFSQQKPGRTPRPPAT